MSDHTQDKKPSTRVVRYEMQVMRDALTHIAAVSLKRGRELSPGQHRGDLFLLSEVAKAALPQNGPERQWLDENHPAGKGLAK